MTREELNNEIEREKKKLEELKDELIKDIKNKDVRKRYRDSLIKLNWLEFQCEKEIETPTLKNKFTNIL